jgi:transcription termination/antitermination protein NusG
MTYSADIMSETATTASGKKWYVVRAISGKEKKVKQYIESEIAHHNIGQYVSQVLIPTENYYQIKY